MCSEPHHSTIEKGVPKQGNRTGSVAARTHGCFEMFRQIVVFHEFLDTFGTMLQKLIRFECPLCRGSLSFHPKASPKLAPKPPKISKMKDFYGLGLLQNQSCRARMQF